MADVGSVRRIDAGALSFKHLFISVFVLLLSAMTYLYFKEMDVGLWMDYHQEFMHSFSDKVGDYCWDLGGGLSNEIEEMALGFKTIQVKGLMQSIV